MSRATHELRYATSVTAADKMPVLSGASGRLDYIELGDTWFGKHELVACVFRILAGSPNTASLLDEEGDGSHTPVNVASVTLSSTAATVTFDQTFAGIGCICAGPDEGYAGRYVVGVTPGLSSCTLTFKTIAGVAVNPQTEAFTTTHFANSNWWVVGVMPAS